MSANIIVVANKNMDFDKWRKTGGGKDRFVVVVMVRCNNSGHSVVGKRWGFDEDLNDMLWNKTKHNN